MWFRLMVNSECVGVVDVQRRERLDLSDKTAIADVVSTYTVSRDGRPVGTLQHRYGSGAFALAEKACAMVADAELGPAS